ncbi:MAG: secretin N-terminal domain-containing protein [Phycisphaerales bacterium JB054]
MRSNASIVGVAAACLWLLGLSAVCAAQPGHGRTQLADTVELSRLVDIAAARLNLPINYDAKVSGSVTLRLHTAMTDRELWATTNRLLGSRGYTTIRMAEDGAMTVVQLSAAAALAQIESLDDFLSSETEHATPGFRVVMVPLSRGSIDDIAAAIRPLLSSPGGTATPMPSLESILIADQEARVRLVVQAIETMESRTTPILPVEIAIEHGDIQQIMTTATQIAAKRTAAGGAALRGDLIAGAGGRSILIVAPAPEIETWRTLIAQLDTRVAAETVTYSTGGLVASQVAGSLINLLGRDATEAGFSVTADDLTGSLVVAGSPAQHERVAEILDRLAQSPEAVRRPTRTFRLLNRDAEEVVGVVQSLISSGMVSQSRAAPVGAARPAEGGDDPRFAAHQRDTRELQLTADPATNSIIAIGEVAELERLERLLKDLDVRRPQVLLEVLIVSLSESDSLDLGVEIEALINGPNDTVAKLSSLFGLSSTGAGASGIEGNRGAGLTGIVLNPGDFSVVLRALQSLNEGRSLSIPKVLVASNEQASLNSVLEQPYTTLNASDTVATTSFGGSSDAGTEVSVRPQIAEGDHLRLEYQISLSAFVGDAADPSIPPPRQQNSIDSVATIPDGYTIAVGGIELTTEGYAETGIPVLSDIPLLGEAFKNRSRSGSRSRFYVFIRSTILRDRNLEDLKYLSDLRTTELDIDDGWPEPEPRIIR